MYLAMMAIPVGPAQSAVTMANSTIVKSCWRNKVGLARGKTIHVSQPLQVHGNVLFIHGIIFYCLMDLKHVMYFCWMLLVIYPPQCLWSITVAAFNA